MWVNFSISDFKKIARSSLWCLKDSLFFPLPPYLIANVEFLASGVEWGKQTNKQTNTMTSFELWEVVVRINEENERRLMDNEKNC